MQHASDCATHNAPALEPGACDCGAVTNAQKAYALLWRSSSIDPFVVAARKLLLDELTREQRIEALKWLMAQVGPMTDREMIAADIRIGVFPQRSYESN